MKPIRKRLTYANVMSSIAVFLVLGGATAIAAKKIGTSQLKANAVTTGKIKKEAVTTAKIKNDAVTGAKVKESTLGEVPSATNAGNANTVAGSTIRKFFYATNETASKTAILSLNGLTLTASCAAGVPSLIATTSVENSLIHIGGTYGFPVAFYEEDDDFDIGEEVEFLTESTDSVQGTFTYAQPSGTVVTGVFEAEEDAFSSFETDCVISGHAIG